MYSVTPSALAALAALTALAGCIDSVVEETDLLAYSLCNPAQRQDTEELRCRDGITSCHALERDDEYGYTGAVGLCTVECVADSDCVDRPRSVAVCEPFSTGSLCVLACDTDADCAGGMTCKTKDRANGESVSLCVP